MNLTLIDNSHYKLTPKQARQLCIDGKLPRPGHAKRAKLPADLKLQRRILAGESFKGYLRDVEGTPREAWVQTTRLSWWDGKPVKDGWTWALHVIWS